MQRILFIINWFVAFVYSAYLVRKGATPLQAQSRVIARACRGVNWENFQKEATPEILGTLKVSNREVRLLDGALQLEGGNWVFYPAE